jgi:hypothetical protein
MKAHFNMEGIMRPTEENVEKLLDLCKHLDPYQRPIDPKYLEILAELEIDPNEIDPYTLTRKLLLLVDQYSHPL